MKQTPWFSRIENGQIIVLATSNYQRHIRALEGKRCVHTIEEYKEPKEDELRRFYWANIMRPIAEETGHDEGDLHALMKQMFNSKKVMGQMVGMPVFRKGSGLTDDEKKVFIRRVRSWALDFLNIRTEPWAGIE